MRSRGDIERLGSSDPASTANEFRLVANSTGRSLRVKLRQMQLLIALFGILAYIDNVRSGLDEVRPLDGVGGAKVPTFQAVVYFLLIWTAVSVPLGLLLAAMIKFGAGEGLPPDQTDQEFEAPSPVRQRDPVVAEKRAMATILFFRKKNARQSRRKRLQLGRIAVGSQEVRTAMTERAHGQIGLLSPDLERGDSFGTPKKQSS